MAASESTKINLAWFVELWQPFIKTTASSRKPESIEEIQASGDLFDTSYDIGETNFNWWFLIQNSGSIYFNTFKPSDNKCHYQSGKARNYANWCRSDEANRFKLFSDSVALLLTLLYDAKRSEQQQSGTGINRRVKKQSKKFASEQFPGKTLQLELQFGILETERDGSKGVKIKPKHFPNAAAGKRTATFFDAADAHSTLEPSSEKAKLMLEFGDIQKKLETKVKEFKKVDASYTKALENYKREHAIRNGLDAAIAGLRSQSKAIEDRIRLIEPSTSDTESTTIGDNATATKIVGVERVNAENIEMYTRLIQNASGPSSAVGDQDRSNQGRSLPADLQVMLKFLNEPNQK